MRLCACHVMGTLVALVKPRYHASFVTVAVAALLFAEPVDGALGLRLAALYVSFNVLLYGGIYTFNDIVDRAADARHPIKRTRPIASGRLGVGNAAAIGTSLCAAGIATGLVLFTAPILACYAAILALNAAYSFGGRGIRVLDVALNAAPHAVRFLMGALLAGRVPPVGHVAAWFCLAAGIACVRRLVEKDAGGETGRPVLRRYSASGLARAADLGFAGILALCVLDGMASPGFFAIVVPAYLVLVVVVRRVPAGHFGFEQLWLR
jgi:decaprenyl-phosphate phosphoribosyltransferase